MSKTIRITPLRYAILTVLRDALNPMSVASIYAAEPANHDFRSVENIAQAIPPLNDAGLVEPFKLARGYAYRITEQGRAALEGLADPGIDPGHTDEAEPEDEEEEAEAEIDFALWASGMLQIQVGTDQFAIPPAHVSRLRAYLNQQERANESTLFGGSGLLGGGGALGLLGTDMLSFSTRIMRPEYDRSLEEKATAPAPAPAPTATAPAATTAAPSASELPQIDFAAVAQQVRDTSAAAIADYTLAVDFTKPLTAAAPSDPIGGLTALDRLGTPAPGTEAIGRPEVNLDGPNGIGGTAGPREELSHGMTREEQFAETAGRG